MKPELKNKTSSFMCFYFSAGAFPIRINSLTFCLLSHETVHPTFLLLHPSIHPSILLIPPSLHLFDIDEVTGPQAERRHLICFKLPPNHTHTCTSSITAVSVGGWVWRLDECLWDRWWGNAHDPDYTDKHTHTHNRKRATERLGCEMSCKAEGILSCHMCSVYYSLINPQAAL